MTWDERQRALATRLAGRPLSVLEEGTLVVIPSTTFPTVELRKITGIEHYEERMLFTVLLLRRPELRVVFVTAVPVDGAVTDYFLRHLPDQVARQIQPGGRSGTVAGDLRNQRGESLGSRLTGDRLPQLGIPDQESSRGERRPQAAGAPRGGFSIAHFEQEPRA